MKVVPDDSIKVGALHPINWKAKYGGMSTSDLRRLKETEAELSQYKKMYAELAHENYALKDLIEKKL